ncbi:MAG: MBL fold metallo-hydrolase, partial [Myxococcota bacterium]
MGVKTGLSIRFWGTRGSLPSPGPDTSLYGGNTSCVEVRAAGKLIVLDCGSGMRLLGNHLLPSMPIEAHVFFTHYHWDHIMGLPFFAPIFVAGNKLHLHGETKRDLNVGEILSGQMIQPYFPVTMGIECKSEMTMNPVEPGDVVSIDDVRVSCCRLQHPGGALAFRVDHQGASLVYATDIEHDDDGNENLVHFARDADLLIYDATYTDEEYEGVAEFFAFLSTLENAERYHVESGYLPIRFGSFEKLETEGYYEENPGMDTPYLQLTLAEPTENS